MLPGCLQRHVHPPAFYAFCDQRCTHAPEEAGHRATPDELRHDADDCVVLSALRDHAKEAQHIGVVQVSQQRSLAAKGRKVLAKALALQEGHITQGMTAVAAAEGVSARLKLHRSLHHHMHPCPVMCLTVWLACVTNLLWCAAKHST